MITATMCLALAIYYEAGTEPYIGRVATGYAVVNAAATLHGKPVSICWEVLKSGRYFGVSGNFDGSIPHNLRWTTIMGISKSILAGQVKDPTKGAVAFECTQGPPCAIPPPWAVGMEFRGHFGNQNFWR